MQKKGKECEDPRESQHVVQDDEKVNIGYSNLIQDLNKDNLQYITSMLKGRSTSQFQPANQE